MSWHGLQSNMAVSPCSCRGMVCRATWLCPNAHVAAWFAERHGRVSVFLTLRGMVCGATWPCPSAPYLARHGLQSVMTLSQCSLPCAAWFAELHDRVQCSLTCTAWFVERHDRVQCSLPCSAWFSERHDRVPVFFTLHGMVCRATWPCPSVPYYCAAWFAERHDRVPVFLTLRGMVYRASCIDAKSTVFFKLSSKKKRFFMFIFYNLKKGKNISILWSAYSVIHIIYCIIRAVKRYMNCIYIDSDSNNLMIFISKI